MKDCFLPLLICLRFFWVSAEAFGGEEVSKQELKELQAKMSQRQDLALDFEQIRVSQLRPQKPSVSKGHALFQKPAKFRWETSSPKPDVIVFDGQALINFKPGDTSATRYKAEGERVREIKEVIDFVMDFDSLLKRYKLTSSLKKGPDIILKLSPVNKDSAIVALELGIDGGKALVQSLKMVFQNKNSTEFRFSNPAFVPADRQMFQPPAGIKIIDGI